MVGTHLQRIQTSDAIWDAASNAARRGETLHTGNLAQQMVARYPNCGMTLHEIAKEIVRQVGVAGGAAETGHEPAHALRVTAPILRNRRRSTGRAIHG